MLAARPTHEIRRTALGAVRLYNFAVAVGLTDAVAFDHDVISSFCLHVVLPSSSTTSLISMRPPHQGHRSRAQDMERAAKWGAGGVREQTPLNWDHRP